MKKDLAWYTHEYERLTRENVILKLKLEEEEVSNSVQRLRLELELEELRGHQDKIHANTHAIGFHIPDEEVYED